MFCTCVIERVDEVLLHVVDQENGPIRIHRPPMARLRPRPRIRSGISDGAIGGMGIG